MLLQSSVGEDTYEKFFTSFIARMIYLWRFVLFADAPRHRNCVLEEVGGRRHTNIK